MKFNLAAPLKKLTVSALAFFIILLPFAKVFADTSANTATSAPANSSSTNADSGDVYYTNNHYGGNQNGQPAFMKIVNGGGK